MTGKQVKRVVDEFMAIREKLQPVVAGFGVNGIVLTVKADGQIWNLAEIDYDSETETLIGVSKTLERDTDGPAKTRWFKVFFDPRTVVYLEFETFAKTA